MLSTAARERPTGLARLDNPNYRRAPHLRLIEKRLLAVERGEIKRLMVFAPPRHQKSELCTLYFPAWFMGRNPKKDVIIASHTASLATEFGGKARNVLEALGPEVFRERVSQRSSASDLWRMQDHGGRVLSLGRGGSPIGRGAHLMILDDLYGNKEEAFSKTIRDKTWDWWRGTMRNRLEPGAAVIVVMQRWHEEDIAGLLLDQARETGEHWEVVRLPAICEDSYAPLERELERPLGAPLLPERFDLPALASVERDVGSVLWSAQYQQSPTPAAGDVFKREWFRYFSEPQAGLYALHAEDADRYASADEGTNFLTADLATSVKETADWTVIAAWHATRKGDLLLLDVHRARMEGPDIVPAIRAMHHRWNASLNAIEATGNEAVVQMARRAGLPIISLRPKGDKRTRALPYAARMEGGNVFFRRGAGWLGEWEEEHLRFTGSPADTDDQVDTGSYAEQIRAQRLSRKKLVGSF